MSDQRDFTAAIRHRNEQGDPLVVVHVRKPTRTQQSPVVSSYPRRSSAPTDAIVKRQLRHSCERIADLPPKDHGGLLSHKALGVHSKEPGNTSTA